MGALDLFNSHVWLSQEDYDYLNSYQLLLYCILVSERVSCGVITQNKKNIYNSIEFKVGLFMEMPNPNSSSSSHCVILVWILYIKSVFTSNIWIGLTPLFSSFNWILHRIQYIFFFFLFYNLPHDDELALESWPLKLFYVTHGWILIVVFFGIFCCCNFAYICHWRSIVCLGQRTKEKKKKREKFMLLFDIGYM